MQVAARSRDPHHPERPSRRFTGADEEYQHRKHGGILRCVSVRAHPLVQTVSRIWRIAEVHSGAPAHPRNNKAESEYESAEQRGTDDSYCHKDLPFVWQLLINQILLEKLRRALEPYRFLSSAISYQTQPL